MFQVTFLNNNRNPTIKEHLLKISNIVPAKRTPSIPEWISKFPSLNSKKKIAVVFPSMSQDTNNPACCRRPCLSASISEQSLCALWLSVMTCHDNPHHVCSSPTARPLAYAHGPYICVQKKPKVIWAQLHLKYTERNTTIYFIAMLIIIIIMWKNSCIANTKDTNLSRVPSSCVPTSNASLSTLLCWPGFWSHNGLTHTHTHTFTVESRGTMFWKRDQM